MGCSLSHSSDQNNSQQTMQQSSPPKTQTTSYTPSEQNPKHNENKIKLNDNIKQNHFG